MGEDFLMKYKDLLNKITFVQNVLNCFTDYSKNLDKYFEKEENKEDHLELYNYYIQLRDNLNKIKKGKI